MSIVVEYTNSIERTQIIVSKGLEGLFLIGEQNLIDGDFLIFDTKPYEPPKTTEQKIEDLKSENTILSNYVLDVDYRLILMELGM